MAGLSEEAQRLHRQALDHNWDDGLELPYLVLNDPDCDRGTAFLLLWYSFSPFDRLWGGRSDDDRDASDWFIELRSFAAEAETRLLDGSFSSEAIRVDLRDDLQLNRLQIEKLRRAGVPEQLLGPTPGEPFA
jgi:hypothetical protein